MRGSCRERGAGETLGAPPPAQRGCGGWLGGRRTEQAARGPSGRSAWRGQAGRTGAARFWSSGLHPQGGSWAGTAAWTLLAASWAPLSVPQPPCLFRGGVLPCRFITITTTATFIIFLSSLLLLPSCPCFSLLPLLLSSPLFPLHPLPFLPSSILPLPPTSSGVTSKLLGGTPGSPRLGGTVDIRAEPVCRRLPGWISSTPSPRQTDRQTQGSGPKAPRCGATIRTHSRRLLPSFCPTAEHPSLGPLTSLQAKDLAQKDPACSPRSPPPSSLGPQQLG